MGTATNWASAAAGEACTAAVRTDGTLWAWGNNNFGQLGKGSSNTTGPADFVPAQVGTATTWVSVAAGGQHVVAVRADGTLWAWGRNQVGQLGKGTTTISPADYSPVQVGTAGTWVSAAAGFSHTVALRTDGTLWAWGSNGLGQLGQGTTTISPADYSPSRVGTATTWARAAVGAAHTLAVRADGTLWAWGFNSNGQLGLGTTTDQSSPQPVGAITGWTDVAAGSGHSVGEQGCRAVWAWGNNTDGQLGDGSTTRRTGPVAVFTPPAAALSSLTPASGGAGTTVVATGTGLAGLVGLSVNGVAVPMSGILNNTATGFSFVVPAGATATGNVVVTLPCGLRLTQAFMLLAARAAAGQPAFALYPNPARTAVNTAGLTAGAVVAVFDALGRRVTSATADARGAAALALPAQLPPGVYLVRSGSQAVRLLVE